MKGYDLITRFLFLDEGELKEIRIFKKQPLLWRLRWLIIAILFVAITAYKIYIGDFEF